VVRGFAVEITKDTIIADVLREHPECIEVFDKYGMPCRTCAGAVSGTIADGAIMHGLDPETIVRELRECCARRHGDAAGTSAS
jgi:hybrid cluster-associated redox disulfide protein